MTLIWFMHRLQSASHWQTESIPPSLRMGKQNCTELCPGQRRKTVRIGIQTITPGSSTQTKENTYVPAVIFMLMNRQQSVYNCFFHKAHLSAHQLSWSNCSRLYLYYHRDISGRSAYNTVAYCWLSHSLMRFFIFPKGNNLKILGTSFFIFSVFAFKERPLLPASTPILFSIKRSVSCPEHKREELF